MLQLLFQGYCFSSQLPGSTVESQLVGEAVPLEVKKPSRAACLTFSRLQSPQMQRFRSYYTQGRLDHNGI